MKGVMKSPNCNIAFEVDSASIVFSTYYSKAINYVVMVALAAFAEIILTIRQMEYTNTQSGAVKVSLLTIGTQAMMDSYSCLLHLTAGIVVENVFNAFATASFFKFITFSIFEMRYLLIIWKSRRNQTDSGTVGRELGMVYTRFYTALLGGFVLVYYISGLFQVFVFILGSFFIPQIICNATRDSNKALLPQYVVGMAVTRLVIPLYFYACPTNFVHAEPHFTFAAYLVGWMIFQVTVLLLQDFLGPRFFIPRQFLPPKYNYSRAVALGARDADQPECVICMGTIEPSHKDYMVTPCDHIFHSQCLMQWLDHKMECPTCRGALPNV